MALNNLGLGFTLTAKDAASGVFRAVGSSLKNLGGDTKKLKETIGDIGGRMTDVGAKLLGVGAAGVAGLGAASAASASFEKAVAKVATIADKAAFPLEYIRKTGFDMTDAYGGSLETQMDALYSAIGSGASSAAEATSVLASANQLAIGGISSVDKTMTLLMGTMNAYGMDLTQAQKTSDAFFQSVKLGGSDMSVESLVASLSGVTPIASAMGVSLDQVLGSLARMTAVGIPTAQAVTGIKAAIEGIIKPSTKAIAEAKKLGIAFDGAALKSKGLPGIIKDITSSAKFNSKSFQNLFESVDGLSAALALGAEGGKPYFDMMEQMGKANGSTEQAFNTLRDTADFAAGKLKTNFMVALVRVGDALSLTVGKGLFFANSILEAFNRLTPGQHRLIVGFVSTLVTMALLVGGAMVLAGAIASLAAVTEVAAVAFGAIMALGTGVGVAFVGALAAIQVFKAAAEADLGGFGTMIRELKEDVTLAYDGITQLFEDGAFSDAVMDDMNAAGNGGIKAFAVQVFMVGSRILEFFNQVKTGFMQAFGGVGPTVSSLDGVFRGLVDAVESLMDVFSIGQDSTEEAAASFDSYGATGTKVGQVIAAAVGIMVEGLTRAVNMANALATGFQATMPSATAMKSISAALSIAFGQLAAAFGITRTETGASASGFVFVAGVIGKVIGVVASLIVFLANLASIFSGPVISAVSAVVSAITGMMNIAQGVFNVIWGLLTGDWAQAWKGAGQIAFGVVQLIVSAIALLVGQIASGIDMIGRLAGKDMGAGKAVLEWKAEMLKDSADLFNVNKDPVLAKAGERSSAMNGGMSVQPAAAPIMSSMPAMSSQMPFPAAAAAEGSAAQTSALMSSAGQLSSQAPPPPINTTMNVTMLLDGEKVAEIVDKHSTSNANRSFSSNMSSSQ